jgi:tryptophan synthase alpha chain
MRLIVMKHKLMAHLVAYYPDREGSLEVARALADGGAAYLEVQFPFSDPSADGPAIQDACRCALESGFRTAEGFQLVREIGDAAGLPIFIMAYAGMAFAGGISRFLDSVREHGAAGVIIPDLMPGMDEGLYRKAQERRLHAIPVITPFVRQERLEEILSIKPEYVYAALRRGITGQETELDPAVLSFLRTLSSRGVKVLAGFGVQNSSQVEALAPYVHAAIAGTCLVRAIQDALSDESAGVYEQVRAKAEELLQNF